MTDNYVTIGDLEQVISLSDANRLLIDDSTGGDTKSAQVSVLKDYITQGITPHINEDTGTWFVGNTDTGVKVGGGIEIWMPNKEYDLDEFVYHDGKIYRCITALQSDIMVFDENEWELVGSSGDYIVCTPEEITSLINTVFGKEG